MKERVYSAIASSSVPLTARDLSQNMECPLAQVQACLDDLSREGRVASTRKGGYAVPETIGLTAAKISFLRNGTPQAKPLNGGPALTLNVTGSTRCMPDDLVLIRPQGESCMLNALLRRGRDTFAAYLRIERSGPKGAPKRGIERKTTVSAVPCDTRIPYGVVLTGDFSGLKNDQLALLRIEEYPEQSRPIRASVVRLLGDAGSMHALLKSVAEEHGFSTEPEEDVRMEAERVPDAVGAADIAGREDLRALCAFTIDGSTAKDFDDAVSIEKRGDGWRLGIHIADVSHYVQPGSAIDADARARGTSLYLPGLTVPMLPEELSNSLCSLMPDVDRLALSLFMTISGGRITGHELCRSVIHSHARLTYQAVNRLYDGGDSDIPEEIRRALYDMRALSHELRERRMANGAIDLDMDEPEFVLDENGIPEDVLCSPRGEGERIIEDFMLAANETVAALARETELPFVYRVHEEPDGDRLRALEALLGELNVPAHFGAKPHPGVLQAALKQAQGHPSEDLIRQSMLRALKKARYSEEPLGHYALAMQDYCHFTSPIRRYPDLIVHRMLKRLLDGSYASGGAAQAEEMRTSARECSERENEATLAERQGDGIMLAAYYSRHIGEEFDGMISNVTAWGLYVRLADTAEGLVHISTLDDYFDFDRERSQLVGAATGAYFRLGDRVRVRVEGVSIPLGEINFALRPPLSELSEEADSGDTGAEEAD